MTTNVLELAPGAPELTAPVRVEGDLDGSKTLVQWLRTHGLFYLACAENLDRFSEVVGLRLAIPVFRRVQEVRRQEPDHPGLGQRTPEEIGKNFERLERATRAMFR